MTNGNGTASSIIARLRASAYEPDGLLRELLSVRGIVALAFTYTICRGYLIGKVDSQSFMMVAVSVFTFWFAQKGSKDAADQAGKLALAPPSQAPAPTAVPVTTTPAPASGETVSTIVTKQETPAK